MTQPHPDLTAADVDRIVRRDFPTDRVDDFRDVLSEAECPLYTKKWFRIDKLPPDEKQKIIDADWKQYQAWLNRT